MSRIGIDATQVVRTGKGISRYQKNIVHALCQVNSSHHFIVFCRSETIDSLCFSHPQWQWVEVPFYALSIWEQVQLPWLAQKYSADLIYTVCERLPAAGAVPIILQLFEDPLERIALSRQMGFSPRWYHGLSEEYTRAIFRRSLRRATRILTASLWTKEILMQRYEISSNKIYVVYGAPEEKFHPLQDKRDIAAIRKEVSGGNPYILHLASGDPRDNTQTVLKAFQKVIHSCNISGLKLLLVGEAAHLFGESDDNSVIRKPYVCEEELVRFYQGAEIFLDPSLFEGFGFQPLEAMACGVPVVVSNRSSITELVKESGVQVDPLDESAIAGAIKLILTHQELKEIYRKHGLENIQRFNWRSTAKELTTHFEQVLSTHKSKHNFAWQLTQ